MKRWPTKPLCGLITIEKGKKAPESFAIPTKTSLRYLQIEDLRADANVKFCELFSCPKATKSDVIIAWDGANAGTVACNLEGHIGSTLAILRPVTPTTLSAPFLSRFLESNFDYLQRTATGATIPHISKSALSGLQIPIPPLAEQERIMKLLDEADELRKLRAQADHRTATLIPSHFTNLFGDPTHIEKMRWSFKPFGEFAKISYGLADKLDATTKPENGTRILTISNVLLNGSIDTKVVKYSIVQPDERAKARLQKFDLLFNWRNGSEEHVGKTAIWEEQVEGEVLHVSFLLKIRADQSQANPYFLWALINRLRATGYFTRNARMQINRKFNASELAALALPLPPLPLQKEFAQRVTEIRDIEAGQAASRFRLEQLFQSLLHRAFEGEL